MAKYPDECPVFLRKEDGRLFVFRPSMAFALWADRADIGDCVEVEDKVLVSDSPADIWNDFDITAFKPLTTAARELLAWVRQ